MAWLRLGLCSQTNSTKIILSKIRIHTHSSETKAFPSYCVHFASILISKVTLLNTAWNKKLKIQHKSTLYIFMLVQSCAMKAFNRPSFFYFFALNRIIRSLCFCNANRSVCPFFLLVLQISVCKLAEQCSRSAMQCDEIHSYMKMMMVMVMSALRSQLVCGLYFNPLAL